MNVANRKLLSIEISSMVFFPSLNFCGRNFDWWFFSMSRSFLCRLSRLLFFLWQSHEKWLSILQFAKWAHVQNALIENRYVRETDWSPIPMNSFSMIESIHLITHLGTDGIPRWLRKFRTSWTTRNASKSTVFNAVIFICRRRALTHITEPFSSFRLGANNFYIDWTVYKN